MTERLKKPQNFIVSKNWLMALLIAGQFMFTISQTSHASERASNVNYLSKWERIGKPFPDRTSFIDRGSIEVIGDTRRVLVLYNLSSEKFAPNGERYNSLAAHIVNLCSEMKYRVLALYYYSKLYGNGKIVDEYIYSNRKLKRVNNQALSGDVLRLVCAH